MSTHEEMKHDPEYVDTLIDEQADTICHLGARVAALEAERLQWQIKHAVACDTLEAVQAERDDFRKLTYKLSANVGERTKERDAAQARIAKLERVASAAREVRAGRYPDRQGFPELQDALAALDAGDTP